MLPQNNPDRIGVVFDDHRLVANAGLLLPATLAQHLGLRELVDHHLDLGCAPGRANTGDKLLTLVAPRWRAALHRTLMRCVWDGRCSRLRGQGAIHPGHLPAQLPVGACPSTRPGEPPVAGTRMGRWGRTRRLAPDHRPGLHHLRDLWTGQRRGATPQLHRRTGLSPTAGIAAGTGDVLMSRLREGRANTARGAAHFLRETVGRVRYGASGQLTVRADSGFYAHALVAVCREMGVRFSITIASTKACGS